MTHTVWRDTASSACLGAASAETRFAWQILFVQQGFFFKIHFIFWEERKSHLQFASTTTVEVLCAETFSEWLSAVWGCSSVWGRNLSSPNYYQLHACMDGKEKKKLWMEIDIPMLGSLGYCAVGDVYYMFHGLCALNIFLWGIPMWRRDIFFYSPSIRSVVACKFLWMCCTGFPLYL